MTPAPAAANPLPHVQLPSRLLRWLRGAPPEGIERYRRLLGARYPTFRYAFDAFEAIGGRTVVELGTSRSFVDGSHPGVMVNDPQLWRPDRPKQWDWGGGLFTLMCPLHLARLAPTVHSVDISPDAIAISRVITAEYVPLVRHHLMSSVDFLRGFEGHIDLLYMDAGETDAGADELHLAEARIVVERQLMSPGGIVLIDDVKLPKSTASKGRLSIPFLREHGFELALSGYQAVLRAPVQGQPAFPTKA